jgi:phosphoribosylglycinamide formyltransferase-1
MSGTVARLGVLISGRGSNMAALADAVADGRLPAEIALVLSNEPEAPGLALAADRGLPVAVADHRGRPRAEHDAAVSALLEEAGATLVCLAGYMRLLSAPFVRRHRGRILNVHPSLLPAFPGLHAQRQALEHGVKVAGATVHLVDEQLDHGPILLQAAVPVRDDDTEDSLSARILTVEHRLYPEAVRLLAEGRLRIEGRRVVRR